MRNLRSVVFTAVGALISSGFALDVSAQCSGGGGGGRGGASAASVGTAGYSASSSPFTLMNSSYPSSRGYSAMNPMAFQQAVYQQNAYQEQLNSQRQMMFVAKQQAGRLARLKSMTADDDSSNNTTLHLSNHEVVESEESVSPAERLFVLATRADKAGRDSTAERYYKRVIAMAPESAVASRASDKLSQMH